MGVQISYDIVGAGWAKCTIRVDDACATVTASYLSDALDDLASAVAASLRGHPHATASFTEELGEYRWIFEPLSEGRVSVCILEFKETAARSALFRRKGVLYSVPKMTIKTKSMMRRRVNRAGPSGLV